MGEEPAKVDGLTSAASASGGEWPDDPLFALLDGLRSEGFRLGVKEYLDAQEAAAAFLRDRTDGDPARLRNYLAPVLCTNPEQQQLFYRRFEEWQRNLDPGRGKEVEGDGGGDSHESRPGDRASEARPWRWWLASFVGTVAVVTGVVWGPSLPALGASAAQMWRNWFVLGELTVSATGADGTGVPNATLTVRGEGAEHSSSTAADGRAQIMLPRGRYHLLAQAFGFAPGGWEVEVDRKTSIQLKLAPLPRGALGGRVTDAQGRGLPGAALACDGCKDTLSDPAGHFDLGPFPEGVCKVRASREGYQPAMAAGRVVRGRRTELRLVMAVIPVRVRVTDPDKRPLAAANVSRLGGTESGVTSADGMVEVGGVPVGKLRFVAEKEGFSRAAADTLVEAGKTAEVAITLERARSSLMVRVVDLAGKPLAGAAVRLEYSTGKPIAVLKGHSDEVTTASFSPDGLRVVSGSDDGTVRVWNAVTGQLIAVLRTGSGRVTAAFTHFGRRVVTGTSDGSFGVWDAETGRPVGGRSARPGASAVAFSPDGARAALASAQGNVEIWDTVTGLTIANLNGPALGLLVVAFSPDGLRVVTVFKDGQTQIWDAVTGRQIAILQGELGGVNAASFSPDGTRVATASADKTARIWNAATGELIATLKGHKGPVEEVSYSPDGTRLVTASSDGTARIWNSAGGGSTATLWAFKGLYADRVTAVSFSPDGTRLATGDEDGTVRIWNAANGQPIGGLEHGLRVNAASFNPDGTRVLTASADRTVRIWNVGSAPVEAVSDGDGQSRLTLDSAAAQHAVSIARVDYSSPPRMTLPSDTLGGTVRAEMAAVTLWERLVRHRRRVQTGLALLPLACAGPWVGWRVRRRRQLVLERRAASEERPVASSPLPEPEHDLYRGASFARARVEVLRRQATGTGELDANATVEATVGRLGHFTPVYRRRLEPPFYLVLIDRTSPRDQRASMVDELLDRLQAGGVELDRYDFDRDPRRAMARGAGAISRDLEGLAGLYPQHRLAVFADGAGFTDPVTGRLASWVKLFSAWPQKALLTPVPVCRWGPRELDLEESGFVIVPATEAGVERLAEALRGQGDSVAGPLDDEWQPPFPEALSDGGGRFLERTPPAEPELSDLCEELAFYLGPEGYRWLCSLAVYPWLDWYLTLRLGVILKSKGQDQGPVLHEATLLALTRLPWLRHGVMPDWLRLRLQRDLSAGDEATVREWLQDCPADPKSCSMSRFRLDVARPAEPAAGGWRERVRRRVKDWARSMDRRRLVRDYARAEPLEGPLRDQIYVRFLLGKKPGKLQVAAPSGWKRWVWEQGLPALGPRTGSVALLMALLAVNGFLHGGWVLDPLARSFGSTGRSRMTWTAAPGAAPALPSAPVAAQPGDHVGSGAKAAVCGSDIADFDACHRAYPTGCSVAGKYDGYLNFLKNQLVDPAKPAEQLMTPADLVGLDGRLPDGLTKQNHAQFESALKALGEGQVVALTGYLYYAKTGGAESNNCLLQGPDNIDFHIGIGSEAGLAAKLRSSESLTPAERTQASQSSVIVEMTPHWRARFKPSWTLERLTTALGYQVRIAGQLLADNEHDDPKDDCSLRGASSRCWRASTWELHPVTRFEVCSTGSCSGARDDGWVNLEDSSLDRPSAALPAVGAQVAAPAAGGAQGPPPAPGGAQAPLPAAGGAQGPLPAPGGAQGPPPAPGGAQGTAPGACVPPRETGSIFKGWLDPKLDIALFRGVLMGPPHLFGKRVTEQPAGSGTATEDTCWFPGSKVPRYTDANSIDGASWPIQAALHYGPDEIGFRLKLSAYYGRAHRTPCYMRTIQHIKFVCPSGELREFKANRIEIQVSDQGTTIIRDGVSSGPH